MPIVASQTAVRLVLQIAILLGGVVCSASTSRTVPGDLLSESSPTPTSSPESIPTVRIVYSAISVVNGPLWIAKEAGDFEREGVNVDFDYIATSTTITQSMLAGEIALANVGMESLITANLAGADLVGLAVATDRFIFRLYSVPDVSTPTALHGKRIAVSRLGTSTDMAARVLLRRNGIEPDRDATIVQVGGVPEIFAALQSGSVDAGVLSPPIMFRAENMGLNLLADTTEIDIPFHQTILMSTRRYISANEGIIRRVVRGYVRGVARFKQERESAKHVLKKYTQIDDDAILEQSWIIEDRVLPRVPYPRTDAVQLALELAAAYHPDARLRHPQDFSTIASCVS